MGSYHDEGEYVTSDQFRTQIEAQHLAPIERSSKRDESQENEEETMKKFSPSSFVLCSLLDVGRRHDDDAIVLRYSARR